MGASGIIGDITAQRLVEAAGLEMIPVVVIGAEVIADMSAKHGALHTSLVAVDDFRLQGGEKLGGVVVVDDARPTATRRTYVDIVAAHHIVEGHTTHPRPIILRSGHLASALSGIV